MNNDPVNDESLDEYRGGVYSKGRGPYKYPFYMLYQFAVYIFSVLHFTRRGFLGCWTVDVSKYPGGHHEILQRFDVFQVLSFSKHTGEPPSCPSTCSITSSLLWSTLHWACNVLISACTHGVYVTSRWRFPTRGPPPIFHDLWF